MSDARYSSVREAGREHFPLTPRGFIAIRIVQLILAVAVLGLDAYVLSNVLFDGAELTIFSSIATLIACIYYLVVEFGRDAWKGYNYWAVLSLDVFLLIFWLISFALCAARVAPFANGWTICDGYECIYYPVEDYITLFACMCTATGLGGVEFVLFIVSLSIHSVATHRHRAAGLHCHAESAFDRENNRHHHHHHNNNAPVGQVTSTGAGVGTTTTSNNIPLEEKHDHAAAAPAPSYTSVPPPQQQHQQHQQHQQQQQQQQHSQSLYAASQPSVSPGVAGSPYQPPAVPATTAHQQQQQQQQQQPAAGYYEGAGAPNHQGVGGGAYPHHHHNSTTSSSGVNFFGGPVPAPHPGSYEAQGSPVGYA